MVTLKWRGSVGADSRLEKEIGKGVCVNRGKGMRLARKTSGIARKREGEEKAVRAQAKVGEKRKLMRTRRLSGRGSTRSRSLLTRGGKTGRPKKGKEMGGGVLPPFKKGSGRGDPPQ